MPRIPSSLNNVDTAVDKNINNSQYGNVKKVANNIEQVVIVSNDLELGDNSKTKIVADNIVKVSTTADNILDINTVATNIDEIIIDANNIGHIVTVGTDLNLAGWTSILDAGAITDAIEMEETGISLIKTVATNIDDVVMASNNITIMNTIGDNIIDIQNAEENAHIALTKASEASNSATNALNSETLAHKWAQELEDVTVIGTVGIDDEYSAYHWAKKAEWLVGTITLDGLFDVNTSGITQGGLIRYDETTGWKAYDFTNNDKLGFDLAGSLISTGEMAWNPDEGTLDIGLNNGSVLQVGQENNRLVRNATGSTILNGTVVMFDGTVGNSGRVKVKPYTGVKGTEMYIYGITTQDILSGSDGYMTIEGKVRNINTTGSSVGETWLDGQVLYAKPNDSGRLTNIEPTDTEIKIEIATIINAHTNGTLEVRVVPIDRNFSYSRGDSDVRYLPLVGDFNLDLGGIV